MTVPYAGASTLQVYVGPSLKTAELVANTTAYVVFTYPQSSPLSGALNGFNYSVQLENPSVPPGSPAFEVFQHQLRRGFANITLINMSVYYYVSSHANTTSLVVEKTVVINAWATGVFNKTNSRVEGNFAWKNFWVKGKLEVDFDGRSLDVNTVGSTLLFPLGGVAAFNAAIMGAFGGGALWSASTINFSSLSSPLSSWKRTYNPMANTTVFSKTVGSNIVLSDQVSINGQRYTMSLAYDPSSEIVVPGYAVANGNTVIVEAAPPAVVQRNTAIIVSVAVIVIVVVASLALRRNTH